MISKETYRYCKDDLSLVENYQSAINSDKWWDLHHRRELDDSGNLVMTRNQLRKAKLLYHQPANELIFLERSVHRSIHAKSLKGIRVCSEETRAKIAKKHLGMKASAEIKQKLSAMRKGTKFTELSKECLERRRKSMIAYWDSISNEAMEKHRNKVRESWSNLTDEQRKLRGKHISEAKIRNKTA